jgi:plasmid stability protein
MPVTIQIRRVPEELRRTLKSRAALGGKSLSDYLVAELQRIVERPTLTEFFERLQSRTPVDLGFSTADAIRELRGPLRLDDPAEK